MSGKNALALSIGVLGAVAVLLTGAVVLVPVWVVFIAWASFFILGGGMNGLVRSVVSNLTGLVIATVTLVISQGLGMDLLLTAVTVGAGSAAMVLVSHAALLGAIPAIVWGFASTVGTVAVTGRGIATASIGNPALMAAVALVLGGLFGFVSERVAQVLSAEPTNRAEPSAEASG